MTARRAARMIGGKQSKEVLMDTRPTAPFREEHAHLLEHLDHLRATARDLPRLTAADREAAVATALRFLREILLPHARAEEEVLYPEWARLVGYPDAAVPMVHDHEAIVARVEQLAATRPEDVETTQELLYGLHALIRVHFDKEEDIQLPVFDRQSPEAVAAIIERMGHDHAGAGHSH
jgi:iron-sulfur cluster repair protein YtfE (RIC family)